MDRRNFIKGLTGIAGMAAAGQAAGIVRVESLMVLPPKKIIKPVPLWIEGQFVGASGTYRKLPDAGNDGDWTLLLDDNSIHGRGIYLRSDGRWVHGTPIA